VERPCLMSVERKHLELAKNRGGSVHHVAKAVHLGVDVAESEEKHNWVKISPLRPIDVLLR